VSWRPAAVLDTLAVLLFVGIGRATHAESASLPGFARTAWPFLCGLAIGWGLCRAWRRAAALVPTGVTGWLATVAGGMVLRVVSGQGIAIAFVLVALGFLGAALLGWRAIALGWVALRRAGGVSPGDGERGLPPAAP
jgi:hypothetical protein